MRFWTYASALAPTFGRTCALVATVALAGACTASASVAPPPPQQGAAVMDWTLSGTKDPAQCQATGAATFHVRLYDSAGAFAGEYVQACTTFATTIDGLAPDTYTGQADLLDASGAPRTTQVNLAPFDIIGGASVVVALDFPANSFF